MAARPRALLYIGPRHLFWTTGVYALWELAQRYDVTLLVGFDWRREARLERVLRHRRVVQVESTPDLGSLGRRHRWLSRGLRTLVAETAPDVVIQYNHVYVENLYLEYWTRTLAPRAVLAKIQMGQQLKRTAEDYEARKTYAADQVRPGFLPHALRKAWLGARVRLRAHADYRLVPRLTLGTVLRQPLDLWNGTCVEANRRGHYDASFYYVPGERRALEAYEDEERLVLVRHPLQSVGEVCHPVLYDEAGDAGPRGVVLLPSYGLEGHLRRAHRWTGEQVAHHLSGLWSDVLQRVARRPGLRPFVWKLHPSAAAHPIWASVTERLTGAFPELEVAPAGHTAEGLMLRSRVVISDVSTSLWWAAFVPGLMPVSLDIFGLPFGDAFCEHDGVRVVEATSELDALLERVESPVTEEPREHRPSLLDGLEALREEIVG